MMFRLRHMLAVGVLWACQPAQAQIYSCTAPDGTRVFSDQKCGNDAKQVPGITTRKSSSGTSRASKSAKATPKTKAELADLMNLCKAGDVKSCTAWTHGGGPNSLREKEVVAESACAGGSLPDCELRYCRDGASEECRQRVMESASVSGDVWYLREPAQHQSDGSILYNVRCIQKDVIEMRDLGITCELQPGPERCSTPQSDELYARLDQAASSYCSAALQ